jgi:hypothetical protein
VQIVSALQAGTTIRVRCPAGVEAFRSGPVPGSS